MFKNSRTGKLLLASVCFFLIFLQHTNAQQTLIYTDVYRDYKTAMELFENEKYALAQKYFDKVSTQQIDATGDEIFTYISNAEYYSALCAVELNNPDAEKKMLDFVQNNPGNALMGSAYFQLGKVYYDNKEFTNAITWFGKVDEKDLGPEEKDDYKFDYAYSLFYKKQFEQAQPLFASLKDKQGPYYAASNYYYGFIEYYNGDYAGALKSFLLVKDVKPYSQVVPYTICNIYLAQKNYDEIISYAVPLMADSRILYYPELNNLLGQAYFYQQDYGKAVPYLSYYIDKSHSYRPEDIYQLAYAEYKTNDFAGAAATLKEASNPNDTLNQQINYLAGSCYVQLNKKDDARNAFMQASHKNYDKSVQQNALFNFGKLSYELNFNKDAVSAMKDYLATNPDEQSKAEAQEVLAMALLNTNDYQAALDVMNSVTDKSVKLKEAYQKVSYYSGVQQFNQKNYGDAEKMFLQSLKNPIDANLQAASYFWLGEIYYNQQQYQRAINNHLKFQDLAKVADQLPAETKNAYSNYTIGYCYFKQSSFADASNYFSRVASTLKSKNKDQTDLDIASDATLRLGDCYFMTKDYKKAQSEYSGVIGDNSKGVDYALFQKGMLQGLQNDNKGKIATLQQLTGKYSKSLYLDDAMYEMANTYFITGDNQAAISEFSELLDEKPNSSYTTKSLLKLGLIYYNQKDYVQSEKYYHQAYEKSPNTADGSEAKDALKDIASQTGNTQILQGVATASEQDTVAYNAAKLKYDKEDLDGAEKSFGDYIRQFSDGFFQNEAHFYRAESYFKQTKYDIALNDYQFVIKQNKMPLLEYALVRASWIEYEQNKDYKQAYAYYSNLFDVAQYKENTYVAMKGMLRTAYFLNDYEEVITNADRILNSDQVTDDERTEANYYSGKAYMQMDNIDKAYDAFSKTAQLTTSEMGVESRFQMGDILFQKGKLDDSKKMCLQIINEMPAYEEWVIRSYILLADIAAAKGDYTQAKANLQSIIDNYQGNPQLVDLAKQKLEQIEQMEQSKKPSDSTGTDGTEDINMNNNN